LNKIALFLPDLSGGGAERVILLLAQKFVENGFLVHLILARKKGELLPLTPKDVQLFFLCNGTPKQFDKIRFPIQSIINLAAYLRRNKPDALLSTLTGANLVATLAKILACSPTRLVLREAATINNVRSRARLALMQLLYPFADKVVVLTEHMKSQLISALKLPASKIVCIPNPVDIEKIHFLAKKPLSHPWAHSNEQLIVAIGRLTAQKDFQTLIKSFAILATQKTAKLIILGDGPLKAELQGMIEHFELTERVFLAGFDPNPYRWLNRADLFVLSSLWEGQPNVILEAIALHKPVVTTAYDPSTFELLMLSPRIKIVPAGNPHALMLGMLEKLDEEVTQESDRVLSPNTSISKYIEVLSIDYENKDA
jgi:glycosyltransferase involved in cell wall biosynthesis